MNFRPRKRFGQHWLRSEKALSQIVAAASLNSSDRLLEIGPGTGILTRRLLPQIASLVSVEIDRDLCQRLVKSFGQKENFLLLQQAFEARIYQEADHVDLPEWDKVFFFFLSPRAWQRNPRTGDPWPCYRCYTNTTRVY